MMDVPADYQDFTDIFSKICACTPAPHQPNDLKFELEEGTSPHFGPIYFFSQSELKSLWEFLDEHLGMDFSCPSFCSYICCILFDIKYLILRRMC